MSLVNQEIKFFVDDYKNKKCETRNNFQKIILMLLKPIAINWNQ